MLKKSCFLLFICANSALKINDEPLYSLSISEEGDQSVSNSSTTALQYPDSSNLRGDTVDSYVEANKSKIDIADPFRSLEDPFSDSTKQWVEQENKITQNYLKSLQNVEEARKKLEEINNFTSISLPEKHGGEFYFFMDGKIYKQQETSNFRINIDNPKDGASLFMKPSNCTPKDENIDWDSTSWTADGKMMAYVTKSKGSDWKTIRVKDLTTFQDLKDDVLTKIKFSSPSWEKSNEGFFYSRYDDAVNDGAANHKISQNRVYYHKLNTKQEDDILIYENLNQPECSYQVYETYDQNYLILTTKRSTEEIQLKHFVEKSSIKDYNQPFQFSPIIDEWKGKFTLIHNVGTKFWWVTNYNAPFKRVISFDIMFPQEETWTEHFVGDVNHQIEHCYWINGKLVMQFLSNSADALSVYDPVDNGPLKLIKDIELPGRGSITIETGNTKDDELFLFEYNSYTVPSTFYSLNLVTFELENFWHNKQLFDKTGYNSEEYLSDYTTYKSKDGTIVPMTVIRKKSVLPTLDSKPSQPILTHLTGYGGFGTSNKPSFTMNDILFYKNLEGIQVIAHTRGGGELGKEWHDAGKKDKRQNVFDDFISAAEYLIAKKYTDPNHLVISGGSNGGTLVSVVTNQRPDLFALVNCRVPVTDMLRYQKFTAGIKWVDEYGNAENEGTVDYLLQYSPLHNIKAQKYPTILLTTGDHDDRVVPLHAYKYMATLQQVAGKVEGQNPLLIEVQKDAGHNGGGSMSKDSKPHQEEAQWLALMSKVTKTPMKF